MAVMGGIAILLAAVGLYSVMAYWVAQRTQEIGVRMALGGKAGTRIAHGRWPGVAVTLGGIVCGAAPGGGIGAQCVQYVSFTNSSTGVRPKLLSGSTVDPLIYCAAAAFLCVIALLARWFPARRAATINPTEALRME